MVAGYLKLAYSKYRVLQSFAQFGSDLDKDTKERLAQGERIVEVLKQMQNSPIITPLQVVIIYAVINNLIMDIETFDVSAFEKGLFDYVKNQKSEIIDNINQTGDLSDQTKEMIEKAVCEYKKIFLNEK
ncbi:MAG: F0F1 ATP synthase subunit alpha, partial [Oscillospiraceae bacterium]